MRPIRLELEGFTAYRAYTVLDFEGADLFVLTGPTGSGKSSVIDALTFALYGSVARYQNPNLVHPVISQGKLEARVRFDFQVDDRSYTAVRVVRKMPKGGASTREARLECEGRLLAGNADEVTARVRAILGLNFDQFITCVVLPQGEFARFLHEKPADRQDLLTKLLGVDVYEQMGSLARIREAEARQSVKLLEDELERIHDATDEAREAARRRVQELATLKTEIESEEPELERLAKEVEACAAEAERSEREAALLRRIRVPEDAPRLARELEDKSVAVDEARAARTKSDAAVASVEQERERLPDAAAVHDFHRAYRDRESLQDSLSARREEAALARDALEAARTARDLGTKRERDAREALEEARRELAAHHLAFHLKQGEPCPVCGRKVARLPSPTLTPTLSAAEAELEQAEAERRLSDERHREAEREATLAEERRERIEHELEEVERKLSGAPPVEALDEARRLDVELETARRVARERREAEERAEKSLSALRERESRAWREFDRARDSVASYEPPAAVRTSLADAWTTLHTWASSEAEKRACDAKRARERTDEASNLRQEKLSALRSRCTRLGVEAEGDRPRDLVVAALVAAQAELARIEEAIERSASLRARIDADRVAARVAGALGQHLRATGFERWLLREAFRRLAEGATAILRDLSSGQYSFEYDDRLNFEVVDHRNADERRSARTLSGGETFLASLALALTLAEQTAELAAEGSARLESLFLDEGFGTLDDDTLEIVAAAIEELGAKGRIVGLVTHQQSLAEKIPVQFRVSKGPITATVERVVA